MLASGLEVRPDGGEVFGAGQGAHGAGDFCRVLFIRISCSAALFEMSLASVMGPPFGPRLLGNDATGPEAEIRLGRSHHAGGRQFPRLTWSGAGTVVRKVHRDAYTGETHANTGVAVGIGSATTPARWVVIVRDESGTDHYVNVDPSVWEECEPGDVITANNSLVNLS